MGMGLEKEEGSEASIEDLPVRRLGGGSRGSGSLGPSPLLGLAAIVVVAVAAVLTGAILGPPREPTPSPSATAPTPGPTVERTVRPAPTPVPTDDLPTLPPEARVLDLAAWTSVPSWSSDGHYLAFASQPAVETGTVVHVLTGDGRAKVATFTGDAFAWLDQARLVTFQPTAAGPVMGVVVVHDLLRSSEQELPGRYAGILGDGRGAIAVSEAADSPRPDPFRIWQDGVLGPKVADFGRPAAWSVDGSMLATLKDAPTTWVPSTGLSTGVSVPDRLRPRRPTCSGCGPPCPSSPS